MKEIEIKLVAKDKQEVSVKQKKQVEHILVGKLIPYNGHTIWEIDTKTLNITKAEFYDTLFVLGKENKREILQKPGCSYVSALRKSTALKKYQHGLNGGKPLNSNPFKLFDK